MRVVSAGFVGGDFDDFRVGNDEDAFSGVGPYVGEAGESAKGGKNSEVGSEVKAGEAQAGSEPRAGVDVAAEDVRVGGGHRMVAGQKGAEPRAVVENLDAEGFEFALRPPIVVAGHAGKADAGRGGALPRAEAVEGGTFRHTRSVEGVTEEDDGLHGVVAQDRGETLPFAMTGGRGQNDSVARENGWFPKVEVGGEEDAARGPKEGALGEGEKALAREGEGQRLTCGHVCGVLSP